MEGVPRTEPSARVRSLIVLARSGNSDGALRVASQNLKNETLPVAIEACGFLLEAGETEKGLVALDEISARLSDGAPLGVHRGRALGLTALVLARAKQFERARSTAATIAADLTPSRNPEVKDGYVPETWKTLSLAAIAKTLFDKGDRDGASRVCEMALAAWSGMLDPRNKSRLTGEIVGMLQHVQLAQRAFFSEVEHWWDPEPAA